ncbi:MAG: hypothetical protein MZV64_10280 [Ignavibacteriales bacterium]|nr:hypothetical protein [Ignavibacteriales bacterium]
MPAQWPARDCRTRPGPGIGLGAGGVHRLGVEQDDGIGRQIRFRLLTNRLLIERFVELAQLIIGRGAQPLPGRAQVFRVDGFRRSLLCRLFSRLDQSLSRFGDMTAMMRLGKRAQPKRRIPVEVDRVFSVFARRIQRVDDGHQDGVEPLASRAIGHPFQIERGQQLQGRCTGTHRIRPVHTDQRVGAVSHGRSPFRGFGVIHQAVQWGVWPGQLLLQANFVAQEFVSASLAVGQLVQRPMFAVPVVEVFSQAVKALFVRGECWCRHRAEAPVKVPGYQTGR